MKIKLFNCFVCCSYLLFLLRKRSLCVLWLLLSRLRARTCVLRAAFAGSARYRLEVLIEIDSHFLVDDAYGFRQFAQVSGGSAPVHSVGRDHCIRSQDRIVKDLAVVFYYRPVTDYTILAYMHIAADFESTHYGVLVHEYVVPENQLSVLKLPLRLYVGRSQYHFVSDYYVLTHFDLSEITSQDRP